MWYFEAKITLYFEALCTPWSVLRVHKLLCADVIVGSKTNGKKVEAKVPSGKEIKLNIDAGPIKPTTRQDHEPTTVKIEKKQLEPQQKGVCKDDEAVVGEVDVFPELALLPKEWTY